MIPRRSTLGPIFRLTNPAYLLVGLLTFALGAAIARQAGYAVSLKGYLLGQGVVTGLQVAAHALLRYYALPSEADPRRPAGAGSASDAPGTVSPRNAFFVAVAALACAAILGCLLLIDGQTSLSAWILLALLFLGAYAYAAPPLRLSATGYSEIIASLLVAGLVPALAFALQAQRISALLILSTVPLVSLHLAMLLAFQFAAYEVDLQQGRKTLMVRLGWRTGAWLHDGAIAFAAGAIPLAWAQGMPDRVAMSFVIAAPLAIAQVWQTVRIRRGAPPAWRSLMVGAVALFGLAAYLELAGFLLAG